MSTSAFLVEVVVIRIVFDFAFDVVIDSFTMVVAVVRVVEVAVGIAGKRDEPREQHRVFGEHCVERGRSSLVWEDGLRHPLLPWKRAGQDGR